MQKPLKQLWIITITDLLMIVICFIVLIYSNKLLGSSGKIDEEDKKAEKLIVKKYNRDISLLIPYLSVIKNINNTDRISISDDNKIIKYIFSESIKPDEFEIINTLLQRFKNNRVAISLIIGSKILDQVANNSDEIIEQKIINTIKQSDKIRNILDKNANTSNIKPILKIDNDYLKQEGKEFVLVLEILAQKNLDNEI